MTVHIQSDRSDRFALLQSRAGRALLAAAFWSLVGVVFALPGVAARGRWAQPLIQSLCQWWAWGLVMPLVVAFDRGLRHSDEHLGHRLLAHLLPSLIFTTAFMYMCALFAALAGAEPTPLFVAPGRVLTENGGMFLWNWLVYWLIVGAWQTHRYHERHLASALHVERLQRSVAEAKLNALRLQLDPHFLFNALNTISAQVASEPRLARKMLAHLGDLLRLSLESKDRREIPLAEELAFLDHYLAIQKIRLGDRLNVELQVAADVRRALVPSLIVQPLVENAIRHGLSPRTAGGSVTVTARRDAGRLELHVRDDGVGLPAGWQLAASKGLGLSVTRERVIGAHPEGRFAVNPQPSGGTDVLVSLPLRFHPEESDDLAVG